jgi:flavodoxin
MKKTIATLLLSFLLAAVFAANLSAETVPQSKGKTAIVYFSKTGNTRQACEVLAKTFPANLVELKVAQKPAAKGELPVIDPDRVDLKPYSSIIVASPVWGANLVPAVRAFLKNNPLGGRKVIVLTTTNLAMPDKFQEKHKKLVIDAGGTVSGYYQVVMMEKKDGKPVPRPQDDIQKDMTAIAAAIMKNLSQ